MRVLALLLLLAAAANPEAQSPVAPARALLDRAAVERISEADVTLKSKAVDDWLATHPDDVDALVVAARFVYLKEMFTPVSFTGGEKPPDPAAGYAPAHKLLDRALALRPRNAEAYFWKAHLFGVIAPRFGEDSLTMEPFDEKQAIVFARKAVELAPAEVNYSVALAQYLTGARQPKEAMKVLEALPDGRRQPLYVLLSDFEAFPLPEQAAFEPLTTGSFTQIQVERGTFSDFHHERARAYIVPLPIKDLEVFFTQHWPAFKLGKPEKQEDQSEVYLLAYRWVSGRWVLQKSPPRKAEGVFAVFLSELHNPTPEVRKRLPVKVGDVYSIIIVADYLATKR